MGDAFSATSTVSHKGGDLNDMVYIHRCKSSRCHVDRVLKPFICLNSLLGSFYDGTLAWQSHILIMKEIQAIALLGDRPFTWRQGGELVFQVTA